MKFCEGDKTEALYLHGIPQMTLYRSDLHRLRNPFMFQINHRELQCNPGRKPFQKPFLMINYQYAGSKLLFVGINPHDGSYNRGVPYSNNKMFWYLLSRSGIISETVEALKDDKELKKVYDERFNHVYRLGFVNVIERPSRDVSLLKKGEELPGIKNVDQIIRQYKPPVVCFIGKITYQKFTGVKNITFGWQPDLYNSKIFVMHSPSRGEAVIRIEELRKVAAEAFSNPRKL